MAYMTSPGRAETVVPAPATDTRGLAPPHRGQKHAPAWPLSYPRYQATRTPVRSDPQDLSSQVALTVDPMPSVKYP